MAEGRFASVRSVQEFILEQENKNTAQKTLDLRSLERFLKTKDEDRKIEFFSAVDYSQFIISVRTKDGTEYDYGKTVKVQLLISDLAKVRVQKDDCFPKHLCRNCYRTLLYLRDKLLAFQTRCATTQINLGKGAQKVKRTRLVVCCQLNTMHGTVTSPR